MTKNHPVYDHIAAGGYDDVTQAAKLARTWLKQNFPNTKFRVTCQKYSGGSSMRVRWTDGPTDKMVGRILAPLEGKGFDGSVDYAYSKYTWLMPNGDATRAVIRGSEMTGGQHPREEFEMPHPDALKVCFGCYIFTERSLSDEFRTRRLISYARKWGDNLAAAIEAGDVTVENGHYKGASAVRVDGRDEWADITLYRDSQNVACLPL